MYEKWPIVIYHRKICTRIMDTYIKPKSVCESCKWIKHCKIQYLNVGSYGIYSSANITTYILIDYIFQYYVLHFLHVQLCVLFFFETKRFQTFKLTGCHRSANTTQYYWFNVNFYYRTANFEARRRLVLKILIPHGHCTIWRKSRFIWTVAKTFFFVC